VKEAPGQKRKKTQSMSTAQSFTVRAALKEAIGHLRAGGVPSHTLAAELLLMHVLGRDRAWLYAHPEEAIGAENADRYSTLVKRRVSGEPTQYLTGRQEFWGLEFEVEPGVLIPRPETEHVVEVALERLGPPRPESTSGSARLRIADVGTGSGCLAVALAYQLPDAEVFATDVSSAALGVTRRNAARHGVSGRIHLTACNLLDPFLVEPGRFHLIVSNPPYIGRSEANELPREVREHEPEHALFGGGRGSEIYEPLIRQAEQVLASGGTLVLELGHNSLNPVRPLLDSQRGWTNVGVTNDLAGIPRVIAAQRV